tara:strand:+ start:1695 stop:2573 length:879 start_codon:yes stop_codon:yes gene_type:complete
MASTQTANTGNLGSIQRTVISQMRYTEEHNMPVVNLIEKFTLRKGEKQIDIPKAGTMTALDLTDGIDMTDSEDIEATVVSATTAEVGLKVIITDKLARQFNQDVFGVVGRQMGDAMARKKDTDAIALFSALNQGTAFGADDASLSYANASASVAKAKAAKFGGPLFIVHHPNALYTLSKDTAQIGTAGAQLPDAFKQSQVQNFYTGIRINQVPFFEDGNIEKVGTSDSGIGVIANKRALGHVSSQARRVERQRDASLRAVEMVITEDYGMFEVDDTLGAPMRFEIGDVSTSA